MSSYYPLLAPRTTAWKGVGWRCRPRRRSRRRAGSRRRRQAG